MRRAIKCTILLIFIVACIALKRIDVRDDLQFWEWGGQSGSSHLLILMFFIF